MAQLKRLLRSWLVWGVLAGAITGWHLATQEFDGSRDTNFGEHLEYYYPRGVLAGLVVGIVLDYIATQLALRKPNASKRS